MLKYFTEFQSGNSIAINPANVVCVFVGKDPKSNLEATFISMTNGNLAVIDDYEVVTARINGSIT